nr:hypothetical protein [Tanacetum cinerariifolium]
MSTNACNRDICLMAIMFLKISIPEIATTEAVPEHTVPEHYQNVSHENRVYYDDEIEAIHMILSEIRDDIYSTVDACTTAKEMIARNANPLALVAATPKPYPNQTSSRHIIPSKSHAPTRSKGKEIVKDYAYNKEKMMLCKQEEKGVPLTTEQDKGLHDTNKELDEQELKARYMYMAKIKEVLIAESGPTFDADPLEELHTDNEYSMFANEHEHTEQPET